MRSGYTFKGCSRMPKKKAPFPLSYNFLNYTTVWLYTRII